MQKCIAQLLLDHDISDPCVCHMEWTSFLHYLGHFIVVHLHGSRVHRKVCGFFRTSRTIYIYAATLGCKLDFGVVKRLLKYPSVYFNC